MKIIISGIAAGMSAAAKARRISKDAEITVYEKKIKVILARETLGKNGTVLRIDMMDFCYAPPIFKTWDVLNVVGNVASRLYATIK